MNRIIRGDKGIMENRKRMLLHFMKLLVNNQEILLSKRPIINTTNRQIKLIGLDIKFAFDFSVDSFMNIMEENNLEFDLLDFYIEQVYETLDEFKKIRNKDVDILCKIKSQYIQDEYFLKWVVYIVDICQDLNIDKSKIIIEIECLHNINEIIDKIKEIKKYGFKIAITLQKDMSHLGLLKDMGIDIVIMDELDIEELNKKLLLVNQVINREGHDLKMIVRGKFQVEESILIKKADNIFVELEELDELIV